MTLRSANNITLINNFGNIAICEMTTGETITLQGNTGLIGVHDNVVGNSLVGTGNTGNFTRLSDYEVGNTLSVANNESQVVLKRNAVEEPARLLEQHPAPIGAGNAASSGLSGQCALLELRLVADGLARDKTP